jgi:hypothetical protein
MDYSRLTSFTIGFTQANDFLSRGIRFFEEMNEPFGNFFKKIGRGWKAMWDKNIPSHVFLVNEVVPGRFFAAEMVGRGIDTDNSIKANYLEKKGQRIIGFKRFKEFDDPSVQRMARARLYDLKEKEMKYGFDQLLLQMGLPVKPKANREICSGLVNDIYKTAAGIDFGTNPDPYDIMQDQRGTFFTAD